VEARGTLPSTVASNSALRSSERHFYLWMAGVFVLIARHLADQIDAGVYPAGTPLPSEARLAEQVYGCAKMTLRQAIAELRDWGYVRTLRGRGNFVRPPEDRARPAGDDPA